MKDYIISLKCWNRPIYLYKVLNSLRDCVGIEKYKLIISVDNVDINIQNQIYEAILLSDIHNVIQAEIFFQDSKLGCAGNTRFLLEKSFEISSGDYTIHLEDDTVPSIGCLEYFKQAVDVINKYPDKLFAACTFHRPCHQKLNKQEIIDNRNKLTAKKWFDGAGGFAITRNQWNRILEMGGMFGVDGITKKGRTFDCKGEDWLKEINKSDRLSWVWPFHKYFSEDKYTLYPYVGTVLNIGRIGLHCSPEVHEQIQFNQNWLGYSHPHIEYDTNIIYDDNKYIEDGIEGV